MTMHNDGEDSWFFDDEDECVPWWRIIAGYIVAAALIGIILALAVPAVAAVNRNPPPAEQEDQNEVRIGVMCGDLKGSGAVVIVDPAQGKVYQFHFTCPTGKSI